MASEFTLTIIKPHAVRDNNTGAILAMINDAGFRIAAIKMTKLSRHQTEVFYKEHSGKYFFEPLVEMMSSGPVVVAVLEKENAISDFRSLIGDTDPLNASSGTIRKLFGCSMRENAIHASDGNQNALKECGFFFSEMEVF